MATPSNGVLLDTSVVVRHFRDSHALAGKLDACEELYLPQAALAELYAGAFRSARPEKNVQQIMRFLEAVAVLVPDESTPEVYGRISAQLAQACVGVMRWESRGPARSQKPPPGWAAA